MLNNPNEIDNLSLNFAVQEDGGELIELIPNGENISVKKENLNDYLTKLIKYYSLFWAEEQTNSFLKGFYEIVPNHFLYPFYVEEFEALMFGVKEINIEDWKRNTFYKG